jgi:hypothetical protein
MATWQQQLAPTATGRPWLVQMVAERQSPVPMATGQRWLVLTR